MFETTAKPLVFRLQIEADYLEIFKKVSYIYVDQRPEKLKPLKVNKKLNTFGLRLHPRFFENESFFIADLHLF